MDTPSWDPSRPVWTKQQIGASHQVQSSILIRISCKLIYIYIMGKRQIRHIVRFNQHTYYIGDIYLHVKYPYLNKKNILYGRIV